MRTHTSLIVLACALGLNIASIAFAEPTPILGVTATASSEFTGADPTRPASATTGGFTFTTGLAPGTTMDPDTGLFFPMHSNLPDGVGPGVRHMWLSNDSQPATITYNLGAPFNVDRAWIYNYNENSNNPAAFTQRGAQNTGQVSTSLNGVDFAPLIAASLVPLNPADGTNTYDTPDVIDLQGVEAQYVRFEGLTHFPGGDSNFVGLSEAIFFEADQSSGGGGGAGAVPEPSSIALWSLLGLLAAAFGYTRYRKP